MTAVDIVLPTYQASDAIYKSIDSVISQTYTNWHLYIIDDASGDNRLNDLRTRYKHYNNKITYYQFQQNRRAASCRNYAVKNSHSPFIAFIDQDDVWTANKLQLQVAYLEKTGFDAVHGDFLFIDCNDNFIWSELSDRQNNNRRQINWTGSSQSELANTLFLNPNIRLISSMVRRSIFNKIGGFKENYFGGEDELFWFEIAYHGKIGHIDTVLFYRRIHDSNTVTVHKVDRLLGYLGAIKYIKNNYRHVIRDSYPYMEQSIYRSLLRSLRREKKYLLLSIYFVTVLSKHPHSTIKKLLTGD